MDLIGKIFLFLAVLLWGGLHSLLAATRVKRSLMRSPFLGTEQAYRVAYNAFALLSFAPVLAVTVMSRDAALYSIGMPLLPVFLFVQCTALILLVVGFLETHPLAFLGLQPADQHGGLNTGGLYRWVRHPLYTAGLLFIWFMPIMTANVLAINLALSVYIVIGTYLEEAKLKELFGQEYVDYMGRTPMFLPWPRKRRIARAVTPD